MKTIAIASDHGGFEYKEKLINDLTILGYKVFNCGTNSKESCHYPHYAKLAAEKVANHEVDFGIIICTSGEGVCIAANKVAGVRAGIGYNDDVSRLLREHNDANVICFGQNFMSYEDVLNRSKIFLNAEFLGGRHQIRVNLIEK